VGNFNYIFVSYFILLCPGEKSKPFQVAFAYCHIRESRVHKMRMRVALESLQR